MRTVSDLFQPFATETFVEADVYLVFNCVCLLAHKEVREQLERVDSLPPFTWVQGTNELGLSG